MFEELGHNHISGNCCVCPECHQATLYDHWMIEYKHDWNKCRSCGYMELKEETERRVVECSVALLVAIKKL